ncbi:hypothetical protein K3495_g13460 [Podosphaera aphanis]|nr:hypothetical protein K3495_g13460 [Podosphaera aphanis]
MLDTGAANISTAGYGQAQAYMTEFNAKMDTTSAGSLRAHFGFGTSSSIGTLNVASPIGQIIFHVIEADTPFLLYLQDMNKLGIYFSNLTDTIIAKDRTNHPGLQEVWSPISSMGT